MPPDAAHVIDPRDSDTPAGDRRRLRWLALGLVLGVLLAGLPGVNSPWILGDEFIFVATNPDVTGSDGRSLWMRLGSIATSVHDDLYQPIPIASYAVQWALTGGSVTLVRLVDVLIHAANALLLWWVVTLLLTERGRVAPGRARPLGWAAALLWALHPMFITTYASDMGRTHLLSATFALLAMAFHTRYVVGRGAGWFVGTVGMLLLAMLCKPVPGWVLLMGVLEAAFLGWRRMFTSPRVYLVAVLCGGFAILTVWTSRSVGLMQDASEGLFGDPVARSVLAVWIYVRNLVAPLWLTFWYPPDPQTTWGNPRVWAGLLLALGAAGHATWAWRRAETRVVSIGWAWCAALLLPVVGLVGAREVAAMDRYFYHPAMGVMLVLAGVAAGGARDRERRRPGVRAGGGRWVLGAAVVAAVMLALDVPQVRVARSAVRRAERLVQLNPGDPRALEALGAACDFARNHALPKRDRARVPADQEVFWYYNDQMRAALTAAARAEGLPHYFPGPEDRAPFHRRLSYRMLMAGLAEEALQQAEAARSLQPEMYLTWNRLAHAHQALREFADAAAAYARAETLLPDDPHTRAVHLADYGYLLLFELERDAEACPRLAEAHSAGLALYPALVGHALCLIRYGEGGAGFELISAALERNPRDVQAGLVLAEYHLRSRHWDHAAMVYDALLQDDPTLYPALRGFHEVGLQTGQMRAAVLAWQAALERAPERIDLAAYLAWALAIGDDSAAETAAQQVLDTEPENRLACLAMMLLAVRADDATGARECLARALAGREVAGARSLERAAATLRVLRERRVIPEHALVVQAALHLGMEGGTRDPAWATGALRAYLERGGDSPWRSWARELLSASDSEHNRAQEWLAEPP